MLETWALEIVAAFAAVQLLALAYFYYYRNDLAGRDSQELAPAASDEGDGESVQCTECGAENDPGYQYCRDCVSDLSGESIPGYRSHSPSERSL